MDLVAGHLALAVLLAGEPSPNDHLVARHDVDRRLETAELQRTEDLAGLDRILAQLPGDGTHPLASQARLALPSLSNAELRDLARRAEALQSNPVASGWVGKALLAVLLAIGIWFVVLLLGGGT